MEFGAFLKARRTQLGLTQAQIVEQLSLKGEERTTAQVSHWETGRNNPPIESKKFREALAAALQMDVMEMLIQLEFVVIGSERSEEAVLGADIIDSLPPAARKLALAQLRTMKEHFVIKQFPVPE